MLTAFIGTVASEKSKEHLSVGFAKGVEMKKVLVVETDDRESLDLLIKWIKYRSHVKDCYECDLEKLFRKVCLDVLRREVKNDSVFTAMVPSKN